MEKWIIRVKGKGSHARFKPWNVDEKKTVAFIKDAVSWGFPFIEMASELTRDKQWAEVELCRLEAGKIKESWRWSRKAAR